MKWLLIIPNTSWFFKSTDYEWDSWFWFLRRCIIWNVHHASLGVIQERRMSHCCCSYLDKAPSNMGSFNETDSDYYRSSDKRLAKKFKGLLPKREGRWSSVSLLNNDKGLLLGTACTFPYPKENRANSAFFFQVAIRLTISCYDANARNSRHWLTTPVSYGKFSHIEFVWLPKELFW